MGDPGALVVFFVLLLLSLEHWETPRSFGRAVWFGCWFFACFVKTWEHGKYFCFRLLSLCCVVATEFG